MQSGTRSIRSTVSVALAVLAIAATGCRRTEPPSSTAAPQLEIAAGWRGNGSRNFPGTQPPLSWSDSQNVLWKTALPARSNASPVVAGGRVFVCAEPYTLLCIDAADGRILWERTHDYLDLLTA